MKSPSARMHGPINRVPAVQTNHPAKTQTAEAATQDGHTYPVMHVVSMVLGALSKQRRPIHKRPGSGLKPRASTSTRRCDTVGRSVVTSIALRSTPLPKGSIAAARTMPCHSTPPAPRLPMTTSNNDSPATRLGPSANGPVRSLTVAAHRVLLLLPQVAGSGAPPSGS